MSCEEPRHPVEVLAEEFAQRIRLGERPLLDDYAARHADWADEIRKLFPVLLLMEQPGGKTNGETPGTATPLGTPIEPTQQLGEYKIVREIGRGGMGIVYEAEQVVLGRRVALKILPPAAALSQPHLARFLGETQAAARLHHTNIVPIFGVGEQEGVPYYAMQFIEGQSLQELVRRLQRQHTACLKSPDDSPSAGSLAASLAESMVREQFAPASDEGSMKTAAATTPPSSTPGIPSMGETYYRNVARIGLQVADALAHAHAQGVIHRDIKPSNLLLDTQCTVWITDFGLAKAEGSEDLTASGDVVGTLRYLAPERFRGQTDARSDVYSLGLVLYELVVLRPAFAESDRDRLLQSMLQGEPVPPRQLSPQIPRDLETIILKCMHREPERRYCSAAALADDVRRYLAYEPIRARRLTVPERMGRWCRRNPAVASLSTLALVLLLSGLAAVAWQWRRAENQRQLAEANFQKARQAVNRCFDTVTNNPALQEPGMDEVRKVLLETALPYYQDFLVERHDDPTLSGELARTHTRVGYIQQRIGTATAAIAPYQHARDVYARLVEARPGDRSSAVELTKCHYALAKLYQSISQLGEAEMAFKECLAMRAKLVHDSPGFPDDQNDLADGYQALGILYREAGRLAEAESAFDTAISLRLPIAQDYPAYQLGLAADYCERYIFYENSGRHSEARSDILASVARLNELHQNEPENLEYRDRLAVSYNTLGRFMLYVSQASPQEIEAAYLKALELRESLVREHYRVQAYQAHLATICNNLGLLFALTNPGKAGQFYDRALEVRQRLVSEHPAVVSYQFDLARTYHDMGVWYARTDRPEQANEAYEKALSVLDPLVENRPWTTEWAVVRASTLHNLADLAREQRDSSKSLHYCQRASHALDELIEHEPNHKRALWYQMLVHSVRARVLTFVGRCDEALQDWDRAIDFCSNGSQPAVRAGRANTCAMQGDYISATNQALDLITREPRNSYSHVLAAQVYAVAVMGVRADTKLSADERSRRAEQWGRQAVALLSEAATLGHYRSHANSQNNLRELKVDTEFDSLRDRADFQQLLDQLTNQ